jgi:hypothetical protein
MARTRKDPPGGAQFPGRSLSNTQTRNSSSVVSQGGECVRGDRKDPPSGAQFPGKGLSGTQTRNSRNPRAS